MIQSIKTDDISVDSMVKEISLLNNSGERGPFYKVKFCINGHTRNVGFNMLVIDLFKEKYGGLALGNSILEINNNAISHISIDIYRININIYFHPSGFVSEMREYKMKLLDI